MKRFLLSILMVVIGLSAFSQSQSRLISLRTAYPLVVGVRTVDGVTFDSNGLCMADTPLDSLPQYEIGQIYEQTVRYSEDGHGFFVKADSLKSLNVVYSYEVKNPPQGSIEFNAATGRFKYYPAIDDYKMFTVTFTATNGTESVSEEVEFSLMPKTPSEEDAFSTQGTMPDAGDYTIVAEASKTMYFNNENRMAYSISISGKDVIFDDAVQNKVWGLSGREDIYELNIYAERLIVRSALSFPGANVTVYAREILFEDKGSAMASINTTPTSVKTLADGVGADGSNGGNIALFIKEFKSNPAIRLLANGAKGQSTNRNGTPGHGGSGGIITSTVDVSSFCDLVRGSGGVKFDVAGNGSTEVGPVIAYGGIGSSGRFEEVNAPHAYLHPYYISAVMRYVNDAFINNHIDDVLQICRQYREEIDEYLNPHSESGQNAQNGQNYDVNEGIGDWDEFLGSRRNILDNGQEELSSEDAEAELGLQNNLIEINKMLFKLERGLDYFGNPVGWTPLLSFEVMLANYNNEIDRAVPTLYMYYWLNRVDRTLQDMVQASQFAASTTEQEIDANQELLNSLVLEIPVLQDEADDIANQIDVLTQRIETLQQQLLAQAVKNVKKRNKWKNLFNIGKAVVGVVATVATAGSAISGVIGAAGTFANTVTSLNSVAATTSNPNFISTISTAVNNIKTAYNQNSSAINSSINNITKAVNPLIEKTKNLQSVLANTTVSNSEVQAEYSKLLANSTVYKDLVNQAEELNVKKEELVAHMNQVFSDMTTTVSDISNDALALDALRRDAFTGNSKRDLNAMIYMEKMEQRAKDRLLLYDYYLRKAYEYRLLKPYEGEFNLVGMFERFESLGLALGDVVDENAYSSLKSVFRDRISDMTQEIIAGYTSNYPEQSAPITLVIPKEQLNTINAEEGITLNFHEMGIFASDEENVRIVSLEIEHIKTHVEGNVGVSGYMDLNLTHSGISTFRKDGYLYWFDHRSRNTTSPHTWGMRYDAVSNKTTTIQPSAASTSLLRSIINTGDVMLFSRPSAWSDITLTKKVHSSGGADVVIDSLVIKLQYDFTRRPDNIRNIDITASDDLLPYIACSKEDISGRSNGNGHLYRSYTKSNQTVTFTAIDKYESFYFKNWTDRAGNIVSTETDLTVNRQKDQFYTANYEYRGPLLSVPDTVRISNEAGTYVVNVRNIGESDEELDWYVADSLSTWTHIEGSKEGIDDGSFTFTIDANTTGKERVDFVEILAPESYVTLKKIYIIQTDETNISQMDNAIYIEPTEGSAGATVNLRIKMKNKLTPVGCSFKLTLPEELRLEKDEDGDVIYLLGNRAKKMSLTMQDWDNGSYDFALTPASSSAAITGNDDVIITFRVRIPDDKDTGRYLLKLEKCLIQSKVDGMTKDYSLSDVVSTLTVNDYMLGDVNGDGKVTPSDAIMTLYHYFNVEQATFNTKAADVNGDGIISPADAIETLYMYFNNGNQNGVRQERMMLDPQ